MSYVLRFFPYLFVYLYSFFLPSFLPSFLSFFVSFSSWCGIAYILKRDRPELGGWWMCGHIYIKFTKKRSQMQNWLCEFYSCRKTQNPPKTPRSAASHRPKWGWYPCLCLMKRIMVGMLKNSLPSPYRGLPSFAPSPPGGSPRFFCVLLCSTIVRV